jgi:hypothetical protein
MQPAGVQYINVVWSLVAVYWVVGMQLAKPTIKSESINYARYGQRVRRLIPFVF